MRNIFIRIACVVLVLIMVMSVVSCSKEEEEITLTDTGVVTEETGPVSKVPADLNFDGEEVNFIMPELCKPEFYVEDTTAELDKAILERNITTEERLGIKFNYIIRDEALSIEACFRSN